MSPPPITEPDTQTAMLHKLAASGSLKSSECFASTQEWVSFRDNLFERIISIVIEQFTAPILPGDKIPVRGLFSPSPDSAPSSTNAANDTSDDPSKIKEAQAAESHALSHSTHLLPAPIIDQLKEIHRVLVTFEVEPPHTYQRLAELLLEPRRHHNHLVPWLHALDRVLHVTSGMSVVSTSSCAAPDGASDTGEASALHSWGNTGQTLNPGSDDALGGALLTPIPWLMRSGDEDADGDGDVDMDSVSTTASGGASGGPELRTQSTMTIEGPNGMGSIETVTISLNGVSSMTSSHHGTAGPGPSASSKQDGNDMDPRDRDGEGEIDEDEIEHLRGPAEIGAEDLGPQRTDSNTSFDPSVGPQDVDYERALGRKHDEDDAESKALEDDEMDDVETGSKRGAEDDYRQEKAVVKKLKPEDENETSRGSAPKSPETTAETRENKVGGETGSESSDTAKDVVQNDQEDKEEEKTEP
ncbi:hypothetical protein BROUX41_002829 [Berkeleyomyces rouxiae]|uniref:uncharacterized protein n=1 Tax=Berkeleyomyces rouxiae TaxID=2035830 RepID=UPI003B7FF347